MASRTPKHMPRCLARTMRTARRAGACDDVALCTAKFDGAMGNLFIFYRDYLFSFACRTISSSRSMYAANARRPAEVRAQVVKGRCWRKDFVTETKPASCK